MRRRRVILLAAFVLVVIAGLAGLVASSRYAPLEEGSTSGVLGPGIEWATASDGVQIRWLPYRPGAEIEVRQAVRNSGRFAVDLTDVPWQGGVLELTSVEHLGRLAAGEEVEVTLHLRVVRSCLDFSPGSLMRVVTIPVGYRALGRHRTQEFALLSPLELRFPDGVTRRPDCPPASGLPN